MEIKAKCLSLISGGRDSLLAAAWMIEEGFDVIPFFCNNGHIEGEDRIIETIQELDEVYGGAVSYHTQFIKTGMTFHKYMSEWWQTTPKGMTGYYQDITFCQLHCLMCRMAMYAHATAYCKDNYIEHICDGMRQCESFYVNHPEFRHDLKLLLEEHGIILHTPVYEYATKGDVKQALNERMLPTKVLEPQCYLGCRPEEEMDDAEKSGLMNLFNKDIKPIFNSEVDRLLRIYKKMG